MPGETKNILGRASVRSVLPWIGCITLIAAVLLIGNLDLVLGKSAPIWDAVNQFSPWFFLIADHAKHGKLLLWDPWIDAGSPDFAEPEAGAASPIMILFGLLFSSPFRGFVAYWLTCWILGGVGMLFLCKHFKAPLWGALIVSLGFMTNGFYVGHGEHTSMVYSYSFLPWILWRFDVGLGERRFGPVIQAGALWGLGALGGYPQITILEPFFLVLWVAGFLVFPWESKRTFIERMKHSVIALFVFGVVGGAILSPTYFSFLSESRGYSARADALPREYALTSNAMPPGALKTFASPIIYLLELSTPPLWKNTDVSMVDFYLGALVCVLAVSGLLKFSKRTIWIGCVALIFLSCAVGNYLPVRGWLYDLVPPTRFFRHPSLFGCFSMFAISILAAFGAKELQDANGKHAAVRQRLRFLAAAVGTAVVATRSYKLVQVASHSSYQEVVPWLVWLAIAAVMLLWYFRVIVGRDLRWVLVLIALIDAGSVLAFSNSTISSTGSLGWWRVMEAKHRTNLDLGSDGVDRRLHAPTDLDSNYSHDRNVAIKDPEFANLTALTSQIFIDYASDPLLNGQALGRTRMWFSSSPVWCRPDQITFSEFKSFADTHAGSVPLVLHSQHDMLTAFAAQASNRPDEGCKALSSSASMLHADVRVNRYSPNHLTISYRSENRGWLLITDRWARSWVATVNGKATPILGANLLFRAVPVESGENTIVMQYRPFAYIPLVILSWGSLITILLWNFRLLLRRSQRNVDEHTFRNGGVEIQESTT